jgi:hypothetical protein
MLVFSGDGAVRAPGDLRERAWPRSGPPVSVTVRDTGGPPAAHVTPSHKVGVTTGAGAPQRAATGRALGVGAPAAPVAPVATAGVSAQAQATPAKGRPPARPRPQSAHPTAASRAAAGASPGPSAAPAAAPSVGHSVRWASDVRPTAGEGSPGGGAHARGGPAAVSTAPPVWATATVPPATATPARVDHSASQVRGL